MPEAVYVVSHIGNHIYYYTRDLDATSATGWRMPLTCNHIYYYTRDLDAAEKAAKKYKASIKSYSSLDAALKDEPYLQPIPDKD